MCVITGVPDDEYHQEGRVEGSDTDAAEQIRRAHLDRHAATRTTAEGPSGSSAGPGGDEVPTPSSHPAIPSTYIRVTVRNGNGKDDPGEIAEGKFEVSNNTLSVTNMDGGLIGKPHQLQVDEDPTAVAARHLEEEGGRVRL